MESETTTITADDLDDWLEASPVKPSPMAPAISPTDDAGQVEDARKYLLTHESAVSGQGGHSKTLRAATLLIHDFGLSEGSASALLHEYNQRCQPAWDEKDLAHKIREAVKLSQAGKCENGYRSKGRKAELGYTIKRASRVEVGSGAGVSPGIPWKIPSSEDASSSSSSPARDWPRISDAFDLLSTPPERPNELIEGIAFEESRLFIIAPSKARKSFLQMHLALSVACGADFLGRKCKRGKVLFVNFELRPYSFWKRLIDIQRRLGLELEPGWMSVWNLRGFPLNADEIKKQFSKSTDECFTLIAIDPLYKTLGDADENKASDMNKVLSSLAEMAAMANAALSITHHFPKGSGGVARAALDKGSGSGVIGRDCDCTIALTPREDCGGDLYDLEIIQRDFVPVPRAAVRWQYPVYELLESALPQQQAPGRRKSSDAPGASATIATEPKWTPQTFAEKFLTSSPKIKEEIFNDAHEAGLSRVKAGSLLARAESAGAAHLWKLDNRRTGFALAKQPELDFRSPDRPAVVQALKSDPSKSNRSIADACGVSHTFVNRIRKELAASVETNSGNKTELETETI